MKLQLFILIGSISFLSAFLTTSKSIIKTSVHLKTAQIELEQPVYFSEKKDDKNKPQGWERVKLGIESIGKDRKKPPLYEPGGYPQQLLAAAAYLIPIVDASDLGKYMFQTYPGLGEIYNVHFAALAGIYNGVPFLPFAVFFLMSYICRAPSFPVEVRFHVAQAFMMSLIQFVPSFGLSLLEKGGVSGLAIPYNTAFLFVMINCVFMQLMLMNPINPYKNPYILNVMPWSLRFMNYKRTMVPKR